MKTQRNPSSKAIRRAVRSKYFKASLYDKTVKALGGKVNPTPEHLREARRQILEQMMAVGRSNHS